MKKNRTQTKLRFNTQKDERAAKAIRFAVAFVCFFVLLAGVSFLLLLKYYDFDLSKIAKTPEEESSTVQPETVAAEEIRGEYNFLLLCTADADNEVRFAAFLTVDMDNGELSVSPIAADKAIAAPDGTSGTVQQLLDAGGMSLLVNALEYTCSVDITKYIRSTDNGFKNVINAVGGAVFKVEESIDVHNDDLTFILDQGEQTMNGDTLLKYLRYYDGNDSRQMDILASVLRQKLTASEFESADRIYTKMINAVESDISVFDFETIKRGVQQLIAAGEPVSIH